MGRYLGSVLREELLYSDSDSVAIPSCFTQYEAKEHETISGDYAISLYEVLARVHGINIASQIGSIMETVISTLNRSSGSLSLQEACSKVVTAIARYGIDPTTTAEEKKHVIHSLCKPLTGALIGARECLTSGAAICLKSLVECENWRFASDEMVNKICQNTAVALEDESTQTDAHIRLVIALANHNPLIVEAYSRLLMQSGLRIANAGINHDKRLSAIHMVRFLMKRLDSRSIYAELETVVEEMEKLQCDEMDTVSEAASDAIQIAKTISADENYNLEASPVSITGKHFRRQDPWARKLTYGCSSSSSTSPESRTVNSFTGFDSFAASPSAHSNGLECRSAARKLWNSENGGVDISLKDGLFPGISTHSFSISDQREFSEFFPGSDPHQREEKLGSRGESVTPKVNKEIEEGNGCDSFFRVKECDAERMKIVSGKALCLLIFAVLVMKMWPMGSEVRHLVPT